MIIEPKHADVTTNITQGETREMKVSEKGMAHIVGMLTNAYKDPNMAVIRENFTNEVNAHTRAGVKGVPVKITLPTWHNPNCIFQDFGIGMTKKEMFDNYSQYGESTKLETNEEAGGFGIGAKSGLAIASQFTVISVKDGFKSTAIITKQRGLPQINVVSSVPTEESPGTIVTVPVKNVHEFNTKAAEFFSYVDPSTVLVDGKTPKYALDKATVITNPNHPEFKAYAIFDTYGWGSGASYLIMGNVPYQISEDDLKSALGSDFTSDVNKHIMRMTKYFMAPIGSVELTLNREGLLYSDQTVDFIKDYMEKFAESVKISAQAEADAATDFTEYFKIKRKWQNQCGFKLSYRGEEWSEFLKLSKTVRRISRSTNGSSSHEFLSRISYDEYDSVFFVTGLKAEEYTKINNYLTPFLRSKDLDDGVFYVTEADEHLTDARTVDNSKVTVVDYEELLKEAKAQRKLDRANGTTGTKAAPEKIKYPVLIVAENKVEWMPYDTIPEGSPYAEQNGSSEYLERVISKVYEDSRYYNTTNNVSKVCFALSKSTDFSHVVLIGKSRTKAAFLKRVPGSPDLNAFIKDTLIPEYNALFTDEVEEVASYENSNWSSVFRLLGEELTKKIADDTIVSLASPSEHITETIKKAKVLRSSIATLQYAWGLKNIDYVQGAAKVEELDQKYPLIASLDTDRSNTPSEHIVAYINAVQPLEVN